MTDADTLTSVLKKAFVARETPKRLIAPSVDLQMHVEASRVDEYFKRHKAVVDRSNSALIAFNYFTPEAGLWAIPKYAISIIQNFEDDDFIIVLFAGALASGMPNAKYSAQEDIGSRMRLLATRQEVEAVGEFCHWLDRSTSGIGIEETLAAAIKLWAI